MTDTQTLIREFPKGLLKWFPFSKEEKIIYIGSASDAYYEALVELGHDDALDNKLVRVKLGDFNEDGTALKGTII